MVGMGSWTNFLIKVIILLVELTYSQQESITVKLTVIFRVPLSMVLSSAVLWNVSFNSDVFGYGLLCSCDFYR